MLHHGTVRQAGIRAIAVIEDIGLFLILIATIIAIVQEVWHMATVRRVELTDLLLLFIFLEVIAMVASYWKQGKFPIRIPLYIAMVAMARYLILDASEIHNIDVLFITGAILVLAVAVFVIRYGQVKFPDQEQDGFADY